MFTGQVGAAGSRPGGPETRQASGHFQATGGSEQRQAGPGSMDDGSESEAGLEEPRLGIQGEGGLGGPLSEVLPQGLPWGKEGPPQQGRDGAPTRLGAPNGMRKDLTIKNIKHLLYHLPQKVHVRAVL